jgi:hypothetical protein
LLASCGDGASYNSTDTGRASETYYVQALSEGILRPKENIGAYRAQLVDCLNGKVIRIDAATGNGVTSNPHYDASHPRSARSRVWAMGLRNPCRMTRRPGTGNPNPSVGDPGVLYIGDVRLEHLGEFARGDAWGMNFGWPAFEGMEIEPATTTATRRIRTRRTLSLAPAAAPSNISISAIFSFRTRLTRRPGRIRATTRKQIPNTLDRFLHTRPAIDWQHGSGPARTGIYSGNNAAVIDVGAAGFARVRSPVRRQLLDRRRLVWR